MTIARDLMLVALEATGDSAAEPGDLSLALAGAELLDLLDTGAVALDRDLVVPGEPPLSDDGLVREAVAELVRESPYESVDDWLWRRGRGLAARYLAALESDGQVTRGRRRLLPSRPGATLPTDSPARRQALDRWAADEPVLAGLGAAVRIRETPADGLLERTDEATATVLAAVDDAVTELTAVRQRRAIENAAFDNIWRG
ncbi:GPP34 family phosphoprotein [Streptomyces sp. NPDC050658]|uniref:GOLPH3/VPS74 family protein n=1 Tax=unclassified Streptomyces TaxID=2593676 RepID=UPI00343BD744